MADGRPRLTDIAMAISDRSDVDWVARENSTSDADALALLDQLRVIDCIARFHCETLAEPPPEDESAEANAPADASRQWAHLELREVIGRGAFGVVFRAFDEKLAREVAVKILSEEDESSLGRGVIEEGRLLARVTHPHIVTVYGADRCDGRAGIWMELIAGRTLESIVREQGPFSACEAALIGIDVCNSLAAVHHAGLLHRDVKAQNVMREQGGRTVLMDLGAGLELSRDDEAPVDPAGTPMYMAPELLAGGRPSVRSDIYSVGMLLFRLLTGTHAIEAGTVRELKDAHAMRRRRRLREVRPDVPVQIGEVIERALAFDPAERYDSASAMEYALMAAVGLVAAPQSPAAPAPVGLRHAITRPAPAWLTGILVVATAAIAVAVTVAVDRRRAPSPPVLRADGAAGSGAPQVIAPLTEDERRIWMGYEELAANHIVAGNWAEARALNGRTYPIFLQKWGPDTPMIGSSEARESWMAHLAGNDTDAAKGLDASLFKLEQELGPLHPYTITTLMAKAAFLQDRKRYPDALAALLDALGRRGRLMRQLGGTVPGKTMPALSVAPDRWLRIARDQRIAADTDADWIPDAVEAIIGTNPASADSDGDGVGDGDEDSDQDGWPNCTDYCQGWDPTRVVAHAGIIDPQLLGLSTARPFLSGPAAGASPGCNVTTTSRQGPTRGRCRPD